jgi:hypothetical protein
MTTTTTLINHANRRFIGLAETRSKKLIDAHSPFGAVLLESDEYGCPTALTSHSFQLSHHFIYLIFGSQ